MEFLLGIMTIEVDTKRSQEFGYENVVDLFACQTKYFDIVVVELPRKLRRTYCQVELESSPCCLLSQTTLAPGKAGWP